MLARLGWELKRVGEVGEQSVDRMFSSRAVTKKIAMVRMRRRPWLLVGMVAFVLTVAMGGLMLLRADAAERENSFSSTSFRSEGYDGGGDRFEFVIVSDMDGDTPREARYGFVSHLRHGTLVREGDGQYVIEWKEKGPGVPLRSKLHKKNRGMELSEMEIFEGKVIAADDRTGILYHVKHPFGSHAVVDPWIQLYDGDGKARNGGFKCEWTVVKDGILYVGSHGREVTKPNDGSAVKNRDRMWVKTIDREGTIKHHNWTQRYNQTPQLDTEVTRGRRSPFSRRHVSRTLPPFFPRIVARLCVWDPAPFPCPNSGCVSVL